ncbi:hypothetical protein BO78DRAFT_421322 [Aspergillus sclerotiicarbonarius CBS 121057]|uniref:Uncharacterized protein n=1 Tax=Aspergillus sclerotiicarbonarius (strain CBS 121057 / IBT 28362) TaxID=1448318 RepID=A0A319ES33_ASPSB|nr:hypothetical protein BO78DRAFT_421322 [Aspergillus sclerotiicarbonarius CBS 121057]
MAPEQRRRHCHHHLNHHHYYNNNRVWRPSEVAPANMTTQQLERNIEALVGSIIEKEMIIENGEARMAELLAELQRRGEEENEEKEEEWEGDGEKENA